METGLATVFEALASVLARMRARVPSGTIGPCAGRF